MEGPEKKHDVLRGILEAQKKISLLFPECVLVGGTAAAMHRGHRFSLDADSVLPNLKDQFQDILEKLEALAGWKTSRIRPPVLILGNFAGIDIGIRQLRRAEPLETIEKFGILIPSEAEMCRIKAWLVITRNATRDFLDFIALCDGFDNDGTAQAMASFDSCYPQPEGAETSRSQLIRMLAMPMPYDLAETDVEKYKGIVPPWNSWEYIHKRSLFISDLLFDSTVIEGHGQKENGGEGASS
ncbi:MAG: nucleotidyl transferase AbiEii/AbiGii toxin family protein [Synergistaceae bacterium]|nr:nucleotidyl transferase AbiEii/AbiGii toxin family protein [Synergistaceae bacterium]